MESYGILFLIDDSAGCLFSFSLQIINVSGVIRVAEFLGVSRELMSIFVGLGLEFLQAP